MSYAVRNHGPVQVDLRADNRLLTCWVEPRVRAGDRITLRNHEQPHVLWDVVRVGTPRESGDIKHGWKNYIQRGSRKL